MRGALGWAFELTLRPSSDAVLWDKYGDIAPAVQVRAAGGGTRRAHTRWEQAGALRRRPAGVVRHC